MNKIVIEFCPEDRKRIDELIAFSGLIAGELKSRPAPEEPSFLDKTLHIPVDHPVDASTAHLDLPIETEPAPEPEEKPVSLAEFQKAVTLAACKGAAKKTVKAIINRYAPTVSEVPEDKRAEVMAELAKI